MFKKFLNLFIGCESWYKRKIQRKNIIDSTRITKKECNAIFTMKNSDKITLITLLSVIIITSEGWTTIFDLIYYTGKFTQLNLIEFTLFFHLCFVTVNLVKQLRLIYPAFSDWFKFFLALRYITYWTGWWRRRVGVLENWCVSNISPFFIYFDS